MIQPAEPHLVNLNLNTSDSVGVSVSVSVASAWSASVADRFPVAFPPVGVDDVAPVTAVHLGAKHDAHRAHRVVALQVAFERQNLKPGLSLDRL
jgi:hypothetical protein